MKKKSIRGKPPNKKSLPPTLLRIILAIVFSTILIFSNSLLTVDSNSQNIFSLANLNVSVKGTFNNIIFGVVLNPEAWRVFFDWLFNE